MNRLLLPLGAAIVAATFAGCTEADPTETVFDAGTDTSADLGSDVPADAADTGSDAIDDAPPAPECEPLPSDYSPGADDEWPACISDDNTYHQIQESISSIGRVGGFESIAELLWRGDIPTASDFVNARDIYATGEGLDSRVQRREDEHYPPVQDPEGDGTLRCRDEGVPALSPERCAGPALMVPILNDAFEQGIAGAEPEVNAARIHATLLWFLYVSTHKEAMTCAVAAKDCDSSYAYYTGAEPRAGGIGLASEIRALAPEAHDRVWDGILALRCWRDLDDAEEATDLDTQARAVAQLDTALLNGFAAIVLDRLDAFENTAGSEREAHRAFLVIAANVLVREATERDAAAGRMIAEAVAGEFANTSGVAAAIATTFACP